MLAATAAYALSSSSPASIKACKRLFTASKRYWATSILMEPSPSATCFTIFNCASANAFLAVNSALSASSLAIWASRMDWSPARMLFTTSSFKVICPLPQSIALVRISGYVFASSAAAEVDRVSPWATASCTCARLSNCAVVLSMTFAVSAHVEPMEAV